MAKLFALTFASFVASGVADTFLAKSESLLQQEDVKQVLLSELAGRSDMGRLRGIEAELQSMFTALPKGEQGLLEMSTVRYALTRYFLQKFGWYVKGLDSAGEAWNASGSTTVLKARAPAYILSIFEETLHGKGMGLHELAAFAATLADLVHAEAIHQLEQIYSVMGLPTLGPVNEEISKEALHAFVVAHLLGSSSAAVETKQDLVDMQTQLDYQYPNQEETSMWVEDLRHTHDLNQRFYRNPFVAREASFDETSAFVLQFGHNFGAFQNLECHTMKRKLVELEHAGSGRVPLSRFYSSALAGGWEFMESVEYLRNQGALDESSPSNPSVVIPNYMNSRMNCLTASDYYAVCCLNECDSLMDRLELRLAAPSVEPGRLAAEVASLASDTVNAPRNLSSALLSRLDDIAQHHAGLVPLHGRLFAQWMHHAYPRECSFPHVAGAVQPMYPVDFAIEHGHELLEATQEEMQRHADQEDEQAEAAELVLPWSPEEELVAEHRHSFGVHRGQSRGSSFVQAAIPWCKGGAALLALGSFAVPMGRSLKASFSSTPVDKVYGHLV